MSTTKAQFLAQLKADRADFEMALRDLYDEQMTAPGVEGNWSVKDVLAHITFWEVQALSWLQAGLSGRAPGPGLETTPDETNRLNLQNYHENKDRPLYDVIDEFHATFLRILALVEALPDDQLLVPAHFAWAGGKSLADHLRSETVEHYAEHRTALYVWRDSIRYR